MGRLVVGLDGSASAAAALRWAADEASLHGWRLQPVMAFRADRATVTAAPSLSRVAPADELERHTWDGLERAILPLRRERVPLEPHVGQGSPAEVILERGRDAELVVVGSRGLGGFRGLLLGSVSREVASRSDVPVAIVPETTAPPGDTGRVLVGVDGSAPAAAALRWAATEARARDAELEVIQVVEPAPTIGPPGTLIPPQSEEELTSRAGERCAAVVREVIGEDAALRVTTRGAVGHPAQALLDASVRADLLVVGGRGRRRIAAALLGSTSNACLTHAAVPTVVVPHPAGSPVA